MPGGATSGAATIISSLPFTDADTSPNSSGLWYKYTAPTPAPSVIGVFVYSTVTPVPVRLTVFSPDAVTNYPPWDSFTLIANKAIQIPVQAGVSYYFNPRGVAGAYSISVVTGPATSVVPAGSILINDDEPGSGGDSWPVALLSITDGAVLSFIHPFPAGENADVIATGAHLGRILIHDRFGGGLNLYDPQLTLLTSLTYATPSNGRCPIRTNKALPTKFYVGKPIDADHSNLATVTTVTSAGAFGPTTWVLPAAGLLGIAPSRDETILYHIGQTSATNAPIKCWDLVNNVALTDLAVGLGSSYRTQDDILVLDDGTIVVTYEHTTASNPPLVYRYSANGTVLMSVTMTGSRSADIRLAYALDDPVSFWVWSKLGGTSRFTNLRASDGAVLATFDAVEFERGRYDAATTPTPLARFGHSESCPFLILRVAVGVQPPPACVQGCIPNLGAITGGGQACRPTIDLPTGGGQACRAPAAPDVECS